MEGKSITSDGYKYLEIKVEMNSLCRDTNNYLIIKKRLQLNITFQSVLTM